LIRWQRFVSSETDWDALWLQPERLKEENADHTIEVEKIETQGR